MGGGWWDSLQEETTAAYHLGWNLFGQVTFPETLPAMPACLWTDSSSLPSLATVPAVTPFTCLIWTLHAGGFGLDSCCATCPLHALVCPLLPPVPSRPYRPSPFCLCAHPDICLLPCTLPPPLYPTFCPHLCSCDSALPPLLTCLYYPNLPFLTQVVSLDLYMPSSPDRLCLCWTPCVSQETWLEWKEGWVERRHACLPACLYPGKRIFACLLPCSAAMPCLWRSPCLPVPMPTVPPNTLVTQVGWVEDRLPRCPRNPGVYAKHRTAGGALYVPFCMCLIITMPFLEGGFGWVPWAEWGGGMGGCLPHGEEHSTCLPSNLYNTHPISLLEASQVWTACLPPLEQLLPATAWEGWCLGGWCGCALCIPSLGPATLTCLPSPCLPLCPMPAIGWNVITHGGAVGSFTFCCGILPPRGEQTLPYYLFHVEQGWGAPQPAHTLQTGTPNPHLPRTPFPHLYYCSPILVPHPIACVPPMNILP